MVCKIGAFILLLLVFVHLNRSCAKEMPTATGSSNQLSRISYGNNASALAHPYMINIWYKMSPIESLIYESAKLVNQVLKWLNPEWDISGSEGVREGSKLFVCSGTLISQKCILTAAHCAADITKLEFHGGNSTLGKGVILPEVENVFFDGYDPKTHDMDVAIIKLSEPVPISNMKTIEIDYTEVNDGDTITVAGWGETETKLPPTNLKETNITVMNREECQQYYSEKITENMLCGSSQRRANSCEGDSGGPIIRNEKQIGIVSFGPEDSCGTHDGPVVYVKLSSGRASRFLRQTIADNC